MSNTIWDIQNLILDSVSGRFCSNHLYFLFELPWYVLDLDGRLYARKKFNTINQGSLLGFRCEDIHEVEFFKVGGGLHIVVVVGMLDHGCPLTIPPFLQTFYDIGKLIESFWCSNPVIIFVVFACCCFCCLMMYHRFRIKKASW